MESRVTNWENRGHDKSSMYITYHILEVNKPFMRMNFLKSTCSLIHIIGQWIVVSEITDLRVPEVVFILTVTSLVQRLCSAHCTTHTALSQ